MLIQKEEVQHMDASSDEPRFYQVAMNFLKQSLWEKAMKKKMSSLLANNT